MKSKDIIDLGNGMAATLATGISLPKISRGDTLECLDCNKPILLDSKTMTMDAVAEYIVCPHCNSKRDIQVYHIIGKKLETKNGKE